MPVKSTHPMLIPLMGCSKKSCTVWVGNASVCSAAGYSVYWLLTVISAVIIKLKTKEQLYNTGSHSPAVKVLCSFWHCFVRLYQTVKSGILSGGTLSDSFREEILTGGLCPGDYVLDSCWSRATRVKTDCRWLRNGAIKVRSWDQSLGIQREIYRLPIRRWKIRVVTQF